MKICIYGASSTKLDRIYYEKAEEFGRIMAVRGHGLVFGGGATGLMGSCVYGVDGAGGHSIGIAPEFFNQPGVLYKNCTEFIFTRTMRERKQLMEDHAGAFVMLPGGIGTYEEFFEILTLKQLGQHSKPIAVYNISGYYDLLEKMLQHTVDQGFMSSECLELYEVFDEPETLLDYLEKNMAAL